jgi:cell division septation protein DedD
MAADDSLHEIQLNGKQLVFLFMASTVVAVVIFLCGVMVGRGVRAQRPALEAAVEAASDPTSVAAPASTPGPAAAVTSNAPVAAQETLTYPNRLEGQDPVVETLRPGLKAGSAIADAKSAGPSAGPAKREVAKPAIVPGPVAKSASTVSASKTTAAPARATAEPASSGFVVQVAAVNDRREAETIATRLSGKGYPSFVSTPPNGAARMFRVRIGKYQSRREAETVAARLRKEEQFKPWITR